MNVDYLKIGLKYLRSKNYAKALEYLELNYSIDSSHQSFEALYSTLLSHILTLKNQNTPFDSSLEKLECLILSSQTPEEILGFTFSTITKQKLTKKFKVLALLFHPDKTNNKTSGDTFVKINEAYSQLQSPQNTQDFTNFAYERSRSSEYIYTTRDSTYYKREDVCCGINPFLVFSLVLMVMLLILSIYSAYELIGHSFAFQPTVLFTKSVISSRYGITFWISPQDIDNVEEIEIDAENEWVQETISQCQMQTNRKNYFMEIALSSEGDMMTRYYYLANQLDMSSCEILKHFDKYF